MQGIIFDIDGTLWDPAEVFADTYNRTILQHLGRTDTRICSTDVKRNLGKPAMEFIKSLFPTLSAEELEFVIPHLDSSVLVALDKQPAPLFEGVEEAFQALYKKYDLFIVSNCQRGYIEALLKGTGLGKYVKDYLSNGDTGESKGTNIRLLMERNNLTEAVYVGDTQGDYEACKQAGVPFIWASYGFGQVPDAKAAIKKITDLIDYPF